MFGLKRRRNYVNRSASYKRQTRKTQIKESTKYRYKIAGKFVTLAVVILGYVNINVVSDVKAVSRQL